MSPISKRRVILLDFVECPSPPITRPIIEGEDRNTNESFAQDDLININKQRLQEERGAYLYSYSQLNTNKTFRCGITVQGYPFPYFPDTVDEISFRREEEYNTEKDCIMSLSSEDERPKDVNLLRLSIERWSSCVAVSFIYSVVYLSLNSLEEWTSVVVELYSRGY